MKQFNVLFVKEWQCFLMEWKIFWLPIVFMLLGLIQPVLQYYLPVIIENVGASEGISIDSLALQQSSSEILANTISSQFDQIGIMVIAISIMGMIQFDKTSGILDFILTKPVSISHYLLSKYFSHVLLVIISVSIGYFMSFSYISMLFEPIPFQNIVLGLFYYLFWIAFIVAFVQLMSTIFNQIAIIAILSIAMLFVFYLITGWNHTLDLFLPPSMSMIAMNQIILSQPGEVFIHIITTICWIILLILLSIRKLGARKI